MVVPDGKKQNINMVAVTRLTWIRLRGSQIVGGRRANDSSGICGDKKKSHCLRLEEHDWVYM